MKWLIIHVVLLLLLATPALRVSGQDLSRIGKPDPFSYSGTLNSRFVFYHARDIPARRDPFGYLFSGSLNISIYELTLPFSFSYSNQGTQYGQPFNQFGVSPTYKWATLHLGYRNITHSSLTLAGHQMLGVGFDLNPGKLRVGFMYGRLQRPVQFRPPPDSLSLDTLLQTSPIPVAEEPVYRRTGWSGKIGYGTSNSFVDVILFKAKDDPGSISDDSVKQAIRPAENSVLGLNARKIFFKKLTVYVEGALSAYTRDSQSTNETDLDFIHHLVASTMSVNGTTYFYKAVKAGARFSHTKFNIQADYRRIDPDYTSMGAYFFTNDIEQFNLTPVFYLFQNKVFLTAGLSYQKDNLEDKKLYTTKRFIPRLNLSVNPSPKFGFDLGYQDMQTRQSSGLLELTDSTRINMSNPGFTANVRYNISDSTHTHNFMIMANQFRLSDKNLLTRDYSEYSATILNASYSFFLTGPALGFNLSGTFNTLKNFSGRVNSTGLALGASKEFLEGSLTTNVSYSAYFAEQSTSNSINGGAGYSPSKKFQFNMNLSYMLYHQNETEFSEFTGFVECRYTFGSKKNTQ